MYYLTKKKYCKLQFTTVNDYSLLHFKTMVLWNFDLLWKNYGTMKKSMVLWKKLWYYTENYGTLIYYGKNYGTMEKTMVLQ